MRPGIGGGLSSAVHDNHFFLSAQGRRDPHAELHATLESFFSQDRLAPWDAPTQCIFTARYYWLREKLKFDPKQLPELSCPRFQEWYNALAPYALTLIFPASFINNPSSTFGHTLLRVDQEGHDDKTRLLEYATNYAAANGDENAIVYAFMGIFGGYDGFFSVAPYYEKVTQYNDMENRDIWEYALNFSPPEVRLLVRHLWELRGIPFPYYYFDDNCSFQLLSLLEVARPSLKLQEQFKTWVIPVDTIRTLSAEPGLVARVIFRPSAATKLRHRVAHSSDTTQIKAKHLALGDGTDSTSTNPRQSAAEQAQALDLAYEYLSYQIHKSTSAETDLQSRSLSLLTQRSKLQVQDSVPPVSTPPQRPDQSHASSRLAIGSSYLRDRPTTLFELRPAYHSLLDPESGHLPGAQIAFFDSALSLAPNEGLQLEHFTLLNLTSLTPRDRFLRPTSWYFDSSTALERFSADKTSYVTRLEGGAGATFKLGERSLWYALGGTSFQTSRSEDANYAIGAGPRLGAIVFLSDYWATQVQSRSSVYFAGGTHSETSLSLKQRWTLNLNTSLEFDLSQKWIYGRNDQEVTARVCKFF